MHILLVRSRQSTRISIAPSSAAIRRFAGSHRTQKAARSPLRRASRAAKFSPRRTNCMQSHYVQSRSPPHGPRRGPPPPVRRPRPAIARAASAAASLRACVPPLLALTLAGPAPVRRRLARRPGPVPPTRTSRHDLEAHLRGGGRRPPRSTPASTSPAVRRPLGARADAHHARRREHPPADRGLVRRRVGRRRLHHRPRRRPRPADPRPAPRTPARSTRRSPSLRASPTRSSPRQTPVTPPPPTHRPHAAPPRPPPPRRPRDPNGSPELRKPPPQP
jgi:hypothetical protein